MVIAGGYLFFKRRMEVVVLLAACVVAGVSGFKGYDPDGRRNMEESECGNWVVG